MSGDGSEMSPGVKEYIRSLQATIESQEVTIESLRSKNKRLEEKLKTAESYSEELRLQVQNLGQEVSELKDILKSNKDHDDDDAKEDSNDKEWDTGQGSSIADQVTDAADKAVHDQFLQGMAFEETSGLYYDYKSGYYYDADRRLYYDGKTGTYYRYNYDTQEYDVLETRKQESGSGQSSPTSPSPSPSPSRPGANDQDRREGKVDSKKRDQKKDGQEEGEVSSPSPPPSKSSRSKSKKHSKSKKSKKRKKEVDEEEVEGGRTYGKRQVTLPCVRIVVHGVPEESKESGVVGIGTLFIVTCKGGSVGREGQHDVLLDDVACSKYHAKVSFSQEEFKYYLTDMGSRNGTFVDGKRLSVSKRESDPVEIGHGTLIQIGGTKLICHVHPGNETCYKCEPGVILSALPKTNQLGAREATEAKRKSEMKMLRKKYGIAGVSETETASRDKKAGYIDRAGHRRKTLGSDNPHEKTEVASVDKSIGDKNKGFKLLSKMGWQEGQGLGKTSAGRIEPVLVEQRSERQGLGSMAPAPVVDAKTIRKAEVWKKTQERFDQL